MNELKLKTWKQVPDEQLNEFKKRIIRELKSPFIVCLVIMLGLGIMTVSNMREEFGYNIYLAFGFLIFLIASIVYAKKINSVKLGQWEIREMLVADVSYARFGNKYILQWDDGKLNLQQEVVFQVQLAKVKKGDKVLVGRIKDRKKDIYLLQNLSN